MDPSAILTQLNLLNEELQNGTPAARQEMLVAAQALVTSLQTPSEFVSWVGWTEPSRFACIRTALDLNIFETLVKYETDGGVELSQLAKAVGASEGLTERIMRHLVATSVVAQAEQNKYAITKLSKQLVEPKYRDGLLFCYDVTSPIYHQMPTYFKKTEYQQPSRPIDGPFQFAHKTSNPFYQWMAENPVYLGAFANYMGGYREGKKPWFAHDFYPLQTQLIDGFSADIAASFLVDIGGGKGHDLLALSAAFPSLPGSLVLQDQPEVIASIDPPLPATQIEATVHDFFSPQPVAGARAYFLHSVLHNWNDDNCVDILKALRPALKPGYSKVLVHELVVPDKGATWGVTSMDLITMALLSARERTETEFRQLFEAAGLQVEKVWMYEQGTEAVIEASLPA